MFFRPMHGDDARTLMGMMPKEAYDKLHKMSPDKVADMFIEAWEQAQHKIFLEKACYTLGTLLLIGLAYWVWIF